MDTVVITGITNRFASFGVIESICRGTRGQGNLEKGLCLMRMHNRVSSFRHPANVLRQSRITSNPDLHDPFGYPVICLPEIMYPRYPISYSVSPPSKMADPAISPKLLQARRHKIDMEWRPKEAR